jgi:hypothetical protein
MLTKKINGNPKSEHYALNTIFELIFGKVFQDFKNGQK